MIRSMRKFAQSFDIFGKQISLKFDKNWNTHDTKLGGMSTLILMVFVIIYTSVCVNVMINYGQDTIKNVSRQIKLQDLERVNYNETNVFIFGWISGSMVKANDSIKNVFKYVDIYFEQVDYDFSIGKNTSRKRVPVKWCTQDDFGNDTVGIRNF